MPWDPPHLTSPAMPPSRTFPFWPLPPPASFAGGGRQFRRAPSCQAILHASRLLPPPSALPPPHPRPHCHWLSIKQAERRMSGQVQFIQLGKDICHASQPCITLIERAALALIRAAGDARALLGAPIGALRITCLATPARAARYSVPATRAVPSYHPPTAWLPVPTLPTACGTGWTFLPATTTSPRHGLLTTPVLTRTAGWRSALQYLRMVDAVAGHFLGGAAPPPTFIAPPPPHHHAHSYLRASPTLLLPPGCCCDIYSASLPFCHHTLHSFTRPYYTITHAPISPTQLPPFSLRLPLPSLHCCQVPPCLFSSCALLPLSCFLSLLFIQQRYHALYTLLTLTVSASWRPSTRLSSSPILWLHSCNCLVPYAFTPCHAHHPRHLLLAPVHPPPPATLPFMARAFSGITWHIITLSQTWH